MSMLEDKLEELDRRIRLLEICVANNQKESKSRYDVILGTYLDECNIQDFLFQETSTCYERYLDYRNMRQESQYCICAGKRFFNNRVKDAFPSLYIKHINRRYQNIYRWELKEEL